MNRQPMSHEEATEFAPLYVLGALDVAEMESVREHLATCEQPHVEFEELGGVVPYLLEDPGLELVEPPASLRDRVMAAAASDLEARADTRSAASVPPTASSVPPTDALIAFPSAVERESRARGRTGRTAWVLGIAAVLAIVALGGWNLLLQNELNAAREFDAAVASVVDAASEPGSQLVVLTPTESNQANGVAAIRSDGSVVLAMHDLPATRGSEVYETWVIVGEAAPVPVGDFTVGANGTATVTTRPTQAPPGAIIAVSREPAPGSTAPVGPIVSTGVGMAPTS